MDNSPIYKSLNDYIEEKVYPFHMPGHKQGRLYNIENLYEIDLTEIQGTDNLHNPKDVIKKAQILASKTFGSQNTYFLVNGSTVGLMASITAICNPGDELIVARNCHRSVYNGMVTTDVIPRYVIPEIINEYGIIGGINTNDIKNVLNKYPDVKGMVITSPTYEGFVSDIKKISNILHKKGKILIVDEAHGAHFKFHNDFPNTALELGADIVIQSIHKTLPAFTQSAMLHVKSDYVDTNKIQNALAMYESSSPSYILMAGLDCCRNYLDNKGKVDFDKYLLMLNNYREKFKNLKNIKLIGREICGQNSIIDIDISKLVFYTTSCRGTEIERILRNKYKIQLELANEDNFLAISTVADDEYGMNKLYSALLEIDLKLNKIETKAIKYDIIEVNNIKLNPREAYFQNKKTINVEQSINHVCGEFIIPYPPGIPLVVPGEVITQDIIEKIKKYKKLGIEIIGMKDYKNNNIQIIEV